MNDLISRQAAIDRINKQREHLQPDIYPQDKIGDAAYRICAEFIERLPSAQPRWIPMKERRPEKDGRYLCTFQGKAVHICMYLNGCFRLYGYNKDNLITAWTPLPEPWKGDAK